MIRLLRIILFPISIIYALIMWLRNRLYDWRLLKSTTFKFPVVVIGNLAVGGTGKSPMAEYILRLINPHKDIMLLSRGYGRKTKGFREVSIHDSAALVGDEPLQIKRKFGSTHVYVCEDRVFALNKIGSSGSGVLLDDAYQHRALKPSFSILLFDYKSLLKPMLPLPTGNFRDTLLESKRASLIVVTKCPHGTDQQVRSLIEQKLQQYTTAPIFFSAISYQQLQNNQGQTLPLAAISTYQAVLITGIAKPGPLRDHLSPHLQQLTHINFKDHHTFSAADLDAIKTGFAALKSDDKIIITTEKDYQRLPESFINTFPVYTVPIEQRILFGGQPLFDSLLLRAFNIQS